jgi:hypothetical protein
MEVDLMLQLKPKKIPVLFLETFNKEPDSELTTEDLQFLQSQIKVMLNNLEEELDELKYICARLWEESDKNVPETESTYRKMLKLMRQRQTLKKTKRKLESIQKKIKVKLRY